MVIAPPRLDTLVALVCAVVRPFVDHLAGRRPRPAWRCAPLSRKLSSAIGFTEVALVREVDGRLEPLGVGSATPSSLARSDGFVIIPPESEGFQDGTLVVAHEL
jgi:molybdopterin molybdotransferase